MEAVVDTYIPDMSKTWTPEEIRDLAAMAKKKGISKGDLATKYIGIHATTLSVWMREGRTDEIPLAYQNSLSWVELRLRKMADRI